MNWLELVCKLSLNVWLPFWKFVACIGTNGTYIEWKPQMMSIFLVRYDVTCVCDFFLRQETRRKVTVGRKSNMKRRKHSCMTITTLSALLHIRLSFILPYYSIERVERHQKTLHAKYRRRLYLGQNNNKNLSMTTTLKNQ